MPDRRPLVPVPYFVPIPQGPWLPFRPVPQVFPPQTVPSTGVAAFARAAQGAWTAPPVYPPLPSAPTDAGGDADDAVEKVFGFVKQSPALGIVAIAGLVVMGVVGVVALSGR
jgi:hypothetical protein